jgi:hypothetical protein
MKGKKMCKYKSFKFVGLFGLMSGKPTIICDNKKVTEEWVEKVKQNTNNCCRRICPFYESR